MSRLRDCADEPGVPERDSARTMNVLTETPSRAAACRLSLGLVGDVDERRVLAGQPNLDVAGGKLLVQLERCFRERVEQAQADRSLERQREPIRCCSGLLVAALRDRVEVGPERIDESL